jgi:hypothetical protein
MKNGDLVYHLTNNKRFYIILDIKKHYHRFHDRVRVLCPSHGLQFWFLREDLEVLSG